MTRFARAKGSKASNERVFSEPTQWHEMKTQMLQKKQEFEEEKKRREAEAKRNENYQKFLKEREKEAKGQTEWAEFPEENEQVVNGLSDKSKRIKKQKNKNIDKKLKQKALLSLNEDTIMKDEMNKLNSNGASSEIIEISEKPKKRKLKIIQDCDADMEHETPENPKPKKKKSTLERVQSVGESSEKINDDDTPLEISDPVVKKSKKMKKSAQEKVQNIDESPEDNDSDAPVEISSKVEVSGPVVKKVKTKKPKIIIPNANGEIPGQKDSKYDKKDKKKKMISDEANGEKTKTNKKQISAGNEKKVIDLESLPEEEKKKLQKKLERRRKQVEKRKLKKQQNKEESETNEGETPVINGLKPKPLEKKKFNKPVENNKPKSANEGTEVDKKPPKKQKLDKADIKRRKDFQPNKIMINGNEVELEYFEGFPIKKEDAKHLIQLKKQMISKGLPRSEINRTLKLERRKAEKALAREKKRVCFNCRKFGHNLSECPNLTNKEELVDKAGSGICFKCGSTEHTSFACRVVKGPNYRFATCFICKEQGHISQQCPDNAKGMYPKGGSCRVCGDVTHLKRDCPQFQQQQQREEAKFQVETIFDGNPDDLEPRNEVTFTPKATTKPKVIKF